MSISFLITAIITKPNLKSLIEGMFIPSFDENSILIVLGLIGTTVVPYNIFLHSSLVTEKWDSIKKLKTARIESFILGKGVVDAIDRAYLYIDSGADGIMIHSKSEDVSEILSFCEHYKKFKKKVPLVVVPSTYNRVVEKQLIDIGVDVVIYANHLLRSSYPAMVSTAKTILKNKRSYECDSKCLPIKDILELIPDV